MMLLPPPPGTCPICAVAHDPLTAHNAQSLYYQYRFYGIRGRWPTWADAVAHCAPELRDAWRAKLEEWGVWSEPTEGEPIADPPDESIRQAIGNISSLGFGPEEDA